MGKKSKHTNHWTKESKVKLLATLARKKALKVSNSGQQSLFPRGCVDEAIKVNEVRETVLEEAQRIIYGDREKTYGNPSKNLTRIVDLWNMYLFGKHGFHMQLTERDVTMLMILLKVARDENKDSRDNLVDIIGYAALAQRIIDEPAS